MLAALSLTGCASLPRLTSASCGGPGPRIVHSEDGRWASTRIDVLTYNVEGLPWPARGGRGDSLRAIGATLAALRAQAAAPDVLLFQEVFTHQARRAVEASGYPTIVPGPQRSQPRPRAFDRSLPGNANVRRGEAVSRLLSSGLVIATEFPVVEHQSLPFARGRCAGVDCLANKGVQFARIHIPGVPGALDLYNTHMNSQAVSRAPYPRHLAAHRSQSHLISRFIAHRSRGDVPLIFGGDLNMRGEDQRFAAFQQRTSLDIVHRWCASRPDECEVNLSWDGDAPWMDTQDLQLFWSGALVEVRPVRVDAMFDGANEPRLSDHDGLRVTYELRWETAGSPPPITCAPPRRLSSRD